MPLLRSIRTAKRESGESYQVTRDWRTQAPSEGKVQHPLKSQPRRNSRAEALLLSHVHATPDVSLV
jgi:hypothetical protein